MIRLLWLPPNLIQLALIIVWTTSLVLLAMVVGLFTRSARIPLAMARSIWAPGILAVLFLRVRREFASPPDPTRSVLYVSNHEAALDIPLLFATLPAPLRFIAKRELFALPVIGWYLRATGMIPIDRAHRERARNDLERAGQRLLRGGGSALAFPEGTRSHGGPIKPFKRGPFVLAIQTGLPVVPVAIVGSGRVLHRSGVSAVPGPVTVRVGAPISTEGLGLEDRAALAARVEQAVRELHAGVGAGAGAAAR